MSVAHAQQDWSALFDEAEKRIPSAATGSPAATTVGDGPPVRKAALAECIDHTLLKLDATGEQIDALCDEASRFKFKVRPPGHSLRFQNRHKGSDKVSSFGIWSKGVAMNVADNRSTVCLRPLALGK